MEMLSMLFKFTFSQTNPDALTACLEIWDDYLDQLAVLEESKVAVFLTKKSKPSIEFESLLVSLFNESLKKAQFEHSSTLLSSLDNVTVEEDGETERGSFIAANIEIIAKICVLRPIDILGALLPNLRAQIGAFLSGADKFTNFQILDLGTLLQIAGRLTEHFLGENFSKFLNDGQAVLISLLQLGGNLLEKLQDHPPRHTV